MRALDRDFQLLQNACRYPDRHLEREIRVSLPVIDLPLYQASRSFLYLSVHTIRFQIQYVFHKVAANG
jgi:hypothetical protein